MSGHPITGRQWRYCMTLRQKHPQKSAAAMAGFSPGTGCRAEKDPRPPTARPPNATVTGVMAAASPPRSPDAGKRRSRHFCAAHPA